MTEAKIKEPAQPKLDYAKLLGVAPSNPDELTWSPDQDGVILINWGRDGVGKTRLGLEWPKPIFLFDSEGNTKETISQIGDKSDIFVHRFMPPMLGNFAAAKAEFQRFHKAYHETLQKCASAGVKGTFVLDSVTNFYDMIRYALVPMTPDGKAQGTAWVYGESNAAFQALFSQARYYRQRLYCTARAREIWVDKQPTGTFSAEIKVEALYAASIVLETQLTPDGKGGFNRKYTFRKAQPNQNLVGMGFPNLPYEQMVKLIQTM
jgi:hypothetical protein